MPSSIAHVVAQTVCECDGHDWMEIPAPDRDRYARIGILAEERIKDALLDAFPALDLGEARVFSNERDAAVRRAES